MEIWNKMWVGVFSEHSVLMFSGNYSSILHRFYTFDLEKNTATLKSESGVTQDHRNRYRSIAFLWFPISIHFVSKMHCFERFAFVQ